MYIYIYIYVRVYRLSKKTDGSIPQTTLISFYKIHLICVNTLIFLE